MKLLARKPADRPVETSASREEGVKMLGEKQLSWSLNTVWRKYDDDTPTLLHSDTTAQSVRIFKLLRIFTVRRTNPRCRGETESQELRRQLWQKDNRVLRMYGVGCVLRCMVGLHYSLMING